MKDKIHTSAVCLATSQIKVAAFFLTMGSASLRHNKTVGNISPSTTVSAKSTVCLEICPKAEQTCLFNLLSWLLSNGAKTDTEPASTTVCASYIKDGMNISC